VESSGTTSSEQRISVQLILNKQVPYDGITTHTHVIFLLCPTLGNAFQ